MRLHKFTTQIEVDCDLFEAEIEFMEYPLDELRKWELKDYTLKPIGETAEGFEDEINDKIRDFITELENPLF